MSWSAPLPVTLEDRLAATLDGLMRVVAAHIARDRNAGPLIILLWTSINRRSKRLKTLLARFRADLLAPPRARPDAEPREMARPDGPLPLPRGRGWLARMMPDANVYDSLLRHLVADPEMAALIAASPQAGRLLRPLIGILSFDPFPPCLAPPVPDATEESSDGAPRRRSRAAAPGQGQSRWAGRSTCGATRCLAFRPLEGGRVRTTQLLQICNK